MLPEVAHEGSIKHTSPDQSRGVGRVASKAYGTIKDASIRIQWRFLPSVIGRYCADPTTTERDHRICGGQELLNTERHHLVKPLAQIDRNGINEWTAANQEGDMFDSAEPLTTEALDDSIRTGLRDRLAAVERAQVRLKDGT